MLVIILTVAAFPLPTAVAMTSFNDVGANAWYHDAVYEATALDYFAGTGNGKFSPDLWLTRAMLVQCLAKASGEDTSSYNVQKFKDVTSDKWYFCACNWATTIGLVSGVGDGMFSPDALLTREQLCVILVHFQELFGAPFNYKYDYIPFEDDDSINKWAHDYVHTLRATGTITDRSNGYFVPRATVTRAELAVMVLACMGKLTTVPVDPTVHMYAFWLSPRDSTVEEGKTIQLKAAYSPADAAITGATWFSSDTSVATVKDGLVTAIKPGVTTITIYSEDGNMKAWGSVTVTKKPDPPKPAPKPDPVPTPPSKRYVNPQKPMLALTFDDGPHKTYSNQILDVLQQYGVVATFFEQGINVSYYPAVIQRELSLGCEVGSHTYNHANLRNVSDSEIRSQISKANAAFIAACGKAPTIMRPPYGARNAHVDAVVNMPLILWSVDTLDWKYRDADYVYNYVIKNAKDGDIILMHSVHGTTAQAMKRIVPALINKGFQLVTVSELAYYKGYTMTNGGHYSSFR